MRLTLLTAPLCAAGALALLPAALPAQAPSAARSVTLAEARAMARRSHPEVTAARHAVAAAAGHARQAGAFPNPTLAYSREQTSRGSGTNAQDIVTLEQPIALGGRGARRAAGAAGLAAAEARLAGTVARIDYEVARSYAASVAAERRAALAAEAASAFTRAAGVSEARLAGGDVSGYQHRRLMLEAARYAALELEARVARDSAVGTLAMLIGVADPAGAAEALVLTDTLTPARLVQPSDSLVALALAQRPEILAALRDAEAAAAEARLAGAERIPTLMLGAGYKSERVAGGESFDGFTAGVSLPLPLWDRRGGAVDAARAEAARRDSEATALQRRTARETQSAYDAHQAIAAQLALLHDQLGEGAVRARRAAEAAYAEGEIGLIEWLDAVRAYQEAETTYAMLWAEYIARRAALERATGATLF
jgi:cobalt-zinc-cadmium efflux system outer membrane protein